jgi:hypothetical protein
VKSNGKSAETESHLVSQSGLSRLEEKKISYQLWTYSFLDPKDTGISAYDLRATNRTGNGKYAIG